MRPISAPVLRERRGRVTVTCHGCGATFETIRSQIERRQGGKFCNRQCWTDHRTRNKQSRLAKLLKAQYGMSEVDYLRMHVAQEGACCICSRPGPADGPNRLAVDHDHATGRVRGLLCRNCNIALGYFKDNPTLLASAIRYLAHHAAS